ncbi:hypothetical protein [Nocardioides ferulae]|uniref:hypothetical protein n=1 Tax=Nocardioides ferulae TaxID=2340821 RepID=UPI000F87B6FA|nr:hypothetical protein [Nocardioides ferulae]
MSAAPRPPRPTLEVTVHRTPTRRARLALALALTVLLAALSGCGLLDTGGAEAAEEPTEEPTTSEAFFNSQFTRDGTFQSHIDVEGLDFVYTLYPTKSTPRTNEWYPRGSKFFSFTFQAYDLEQKLRDPFATKRKVYLEHIKVTSRTTREGGGKAQRPYELDRVAEKITFDPEPLTTKYGMLITSPKGAFELRNQRIKPTALNTRGIDLTFTATVWIQRKAGGTEFYKREIKQTVPVAIFESEEKTQVAQIPVNAN